MLLARDFSAHCTWSPLCQLMGHTLKKKSLKHYILDPAPLVSGREIISLSCLRDCFYIVGSFLDHNSISWVLLAPKKTLCKLKETVFSNYFIDSIFSYHGYTLKLILFFLNSLVYLFIYLVLVAVCRLSLVVVVRGLLTVVASPVVEHRL